MSSSRIYIGHLSRDATERDVEKFFRGYGRIREIIVKDGFGFCEFERCRDAEDAVHELHGKNLCGERVIVELSRPRGSMGGGGGMGGRGDFRDDRRGGPVRANRFGPPVQTRYRLTVENLTTRYSWQDLKDLMRTIGEVSYADAHKEKKNEGVVCFRDHRDLKRAMEKFQGKEINGRKIKLIDDTQGASRSRSRSRSHSNRKRSRSRSASHSPRAKRSRSRSASHSSRGSRRSRSASPKSRSGSPPAANGNGATTTSTSNDVAVTSHTNDATTKKDGSADKDNGHSRSGSPASSHGGSRHSEASPRSERSAGSASRD